MQWLLQVEIRNGSSRAEACAEALAIHMLVSECRGLGEVCAEIEFFHPRLFLFSKSGAGTVRTLQGRFIQYTYDTRLQLALLLRPEQRTIHPHSLVILLLNTKIRHLQRHDPPWIRPWHERILAEVRNAIMFAEIVFVEEALPRNVFGGRSDDRQDGIREDLRLA